MATAQIRDMTADEFLLWNLTQERRFELVDGVPVPLRGMSGASNTHDQVLVNIIVALGNKLRGTGCRPTTPDTALRTAIKKVRRPDVMIECAPADATSYEARNPVAVFEILSPSTEKHDRTLKLAEYMRHPNLRIIVHIDPDRIDVVVYRRQSDNSWLPERLQAASDVIDFEGTTARLSLAEIYDGLAIG